MECVLSSSDNSFSRHGGGGAEGVQVGASFMHGTYAVIEAMKRGEQSQAIDILTRLLEACLFLPPDVIEIADSLVGVVGSDEHSGETLDSEAACRLCEAAVRKGIYRFAYAAGNTRVRQGQKLRGAARKAQFELGAKLLALAEKCTVDSIRASAATNLGVLYSDSDDMGPRNFTKALELYDFAASLNLARGMLNAGITAHNLSGCKDRTLIDRSHEYLLRATVIDPATAVDLGGPQEIAITVDIARRHLALMRCEHPRSGEEEQLGMDYARLHLRTEISADSRLIDALRSAVWRRLGRLHAEDGDTAGTCWKRVLDALGWTIHDDCQTRTFRWRDGQEFRIFTFFVDSMRGKIPFFAADVDLLPAHGGFAAVKILAETLSEENGPFFLAGRRGFFTQWDARNQYTHHLYVHFHDDDNSGRLVPLWELGLPDDVMARPHLDRDPDTGRTGQTLAIALNAMAEGVVQRSPNSDVAWFGVGEAFGARWGMPSHYLRTLSSLNIIAPDGSFDEDAPAFPVLLV
jgi:hypothetical protein